MENPIVLSATTLIGDEVRNLENEKIGKIEELMIDLEEGTVAYAVLSFGGLLGLGNKLFAVPWFMLTLDTEEKCFFLDADKDLLERAPGFDKDHWPEIVHRGWIEEVYEFYRGA